MRIVECFSILVASGQSKKCGELKKILHRELLLRDQVTKESKSQLHKFGQQDNSLEYQKLCRHLLIQVIPLLQNVDRKFFLKSSKSTPESYDVS